MQHASRDHAIDVIEARTPNQPDTGRAEDRMSPDAQ